MSLLLYDEALVGAPAPPAPPAPPAAIDLSHVYETMPLNVGKYTVAPVLLRFAARVTDDAQWFDSMPGSWFSEHADEWFNEVASPATVVAEIHLGAAGEVGLAGPLGYWRLGEAAGATKAREVTPAGNHGTYLGAPTLGVAGFTYDGATALQLDGINDVVSIANPADTSLHTHGGDFTIAIRLRFHAAVSTEQPLVCKGGSGATPGYQLVYQPGTNTLSITISDGTTSAAHTGVKDLEDGAAHLVAAKRDGAVLRLYVDGVELGSGTAASAVTGSLDNTAALECGRRAAAYATCQLQDVALFGRALTAAEDAALVACGGWHPYRDGATYPLRIARLRITITPASLSAWIRVEALRLVVDVPDIVVKRTDVALAAATTSFKFSDDNVEFLIAPFITVTHKGGSVNKVHVLSNVTPMGFDLALRDKTDALAAGTVDLEIRGY